MNKKVNWAGASYKEWIGLMAAPIFWVASLVCFVLGLAFRQDGSIFLYGINLDLTMIFSVGLGFSNTAIQIVGNDTDKEEMGMALWLMWIASYMLGIGSNVNFLNQRIGLDTAILQYLVIWGLGVMIEVAPERLLVKFLRAIRVLDTKSKSQPSQSITPSPQSAPRRVRPQQPEDIRVANGYARPLTGALPQRPKPVRSESNQTPDDLPEFLRVRLE